MPPPDEIRAFLPATLATVLDEPDEGSFLDNTEFMRTLEALAMLHALFKLSVECQHRVISFSRHAQPRPSARSRTRSRTLPAPAVTLATRGRLASSVRPPTQCPT